MRALDVVDELGEEPLGVALAEHDHVVEALAAEGADGTLRVGVHHGRATGREHLGTPIERAASLKSPT